jgi:hypothetical protein
MKTCGKRHFLSALGAALLVTAGVLAQIPTVTKTADKQKEVGPAIGERIPEFKARDQMGRERSLASLAGRSGLLLLFVRSADW